MTIESPNPSTELPQESIDLFKLMKPCEVKLQRLSKHDIEIAIAQKSQDVKLKAVQETIRSMPRKIDFLITFLSIFFQIISEN